MGCRCELNLSCGLRYGERRLSLARLAIASDLNFSVEVFDGSVDPI